MDIGHADGLFLVHKPFLPQNIIFAKMPDVKEMLFLPCKTEEI